jgi:arylsulfatase A-like enzyme
MKNVIVLLLDALRYDQVTSNIAPNLVRIASDGMFYTNAQAPNSHTQCTMPFYLSGRKAYDPQNSIQHTLRNHGYHSCLVNTNLIVELWFSNGWDEVHNHGYKQPIKRKTREIMRPKLWGTIPQPIFYIVQTLFNFATFKLPYWTADMMLKLALNRVEEFQRKSTLFFLWVHLMDAHQPYYPSRSKYPEWYLRWMYVKQYNHMAGRWKLSRKDLKTLKKLYQLNISEMDESLGHFYDTIDLNNTILIVLSDHGDAFNEHGIIGHQPNHFYPELQHVPLIIVGNERGVNDQLVNLIDLPTLICEEIGYTLNA